MTTLDGRPDVGSAGTVLVVDDEVAVRDAFQRALSREQYEVLTAATAEEALKHVNERPIECIVLDAHLPRATADQLVPRLREVDPQAEIVLLTSTSHPAARLPGVVEQLAKPVDLVDLLAAVRRGVLRHAGLHEEQYEVRILVESAVAALVVALEARDPHLRGHSARVAGLAAAIATAAGLPPMDVADIRLAGHLHDVGKIGIPDALLHKPGPLSDAEFAEVREHPELGARILASMTQLGPVIDYVRHHHERWDGSGYPAGLAGEAIPRGARILAIAEIFDALTTPRPYQRTLTAREALARLEELSGSWLDPEAHRALRTVVSTERLP